MDKRPGQAADQRGCARATNGAVLATGRSGLPSLGQRVGVHGEGGAGVAGSVERAQAVHRARQPVGEWVVLPENPCRDGVLAPKHRNQWTRGNHRVYWGRGRKADKRA